jgi:RES domain-containing protein
MHFKGELYRALNLIYARGPLSGRGAELYGGRYNHKGTPALYTSLSVMTALREANQAGSLQPTTLVSYDADLERVFECRDDAALRSQKMDTAALAVTTWRDQMKATGEANTQAFAHRFAAMGYHGLLVRSFAPGTTDDDLNLVLWKWRNAAPCRLTLIDDEHRLSWSHRDPAGTYTAGSGWANQHPNGRDETLSRPKSYGYHFAKTRHRWREKRRSRSARERLIARSHRAIHFWRVAGNEVQASPHQ